MKCIHPLTSLTKTLSKKPIISIILYSQNHDLLEKNVCWVCVKNTYIIMIYVLVCFLYIFCFISEVEFTFIFVQCTPNPLFLFFLFFVCLFFSVLNESINNIRVFDIFFLSAPTILYTRDILRIFFVWIFLVHYISNFLQFSDYDECQQRGRCQHKCHNTQGSFTCSCPDGYRLAANGRTCTGKIATCILNNKWIYYCYTEWHHDV